MYIISEVILDIDKWHPECPTSTWPSVNDTPPAELTPYGLLCWQYWYINAMIIFCFEAPFAYAGMCFADKSDQQEYHTYAYHSMFDTKSEIKRKAYAIAFRHYQFHQCLPKLLH